ncbi:hypothetical protein H9Q09_01090 [Aurantimonas sp. DM33-3]|uniref:hypothetical protein n=1 Tax=Aurantimonas sp. DM33-3 TaxID=2766955 RepID=UPI001651FC2C|nr:hypothetical protein [Aurantimonas sp. DM33-3]MBC6714780.1 hypothetical protein [Aurantimonas sp. DM33-3]
MARIVVQKTNVKLVLSLRDRAALFGRGDWKKHANRGVIDAGRKTKTQVQRAVYRQMALKEGHYQRYVVSGTRGIPRKAQLAYEIFGVPGGQRIEIYKGLRAMKMSGAAAARFNSGRGAGDAGSVRSGVWNNPRVFKRSFATGSGFFALLPKSAGGSGTAPKALWTFGAKPDQNRDDRGRFASSGIRYGKVRRLYGPALQKEIPKDASLATFLAVAPVELEQKVMKRLTPLMRF